MKSTDFLIARLTFVFWVLALPVLAYDTYQMPPSTGQDLPLSVKSRTLLKRLFDQPHILGGQVIGTVRQGGIDQIDIGEVGGVQKGDVFALFTPKGEPVGFIRVQYLQRFTASFEYLELTVDPTTDLIVKKITRQIQKQLPKNFFLPSVEPAAKPWPIPSAGRTRTRKVKYEKTTPNSLPPLPSNETKVSTGSNLPPIPGIGPMGSAKTLPPLPMDNSGSTTFPMELAPPKGDMPPIPNLPNQSPNPSVVPSVGSLNLPPLPDSK